MKWKNSTIGKSDVYTSNPLSRKTAYQFRADEDRDILRIPYSLWLLTKYK